MTALTLLPISTKEYTPNDTVMIIGISFTELIADFFFEGTELSADDLRHRHVGPPHRGAK
jgi:hypothetical protein